MSDVSDLLEEFGGPVDFTRTSPGEYSEDGELFNEGAQEVLQDVITVIQPGRPNERELLPEGVRTSEFLKLYCEITLQIDDRNEKTVADTFVENGRKYKLVVVSEPGKPLPHTKAFASFTGEIVE